MAPMERTTSSRALDRLTAEYWATYLEANPLNATAIGDPRFDDQLADHTLRLLVHLDELDAHTRGLLRRCFGGLALPNHATDALHQLLVVGDLHLELQ